MDAHPKIRKVAAFIKLARRLQIWRRNQLDVQMWELLNTKQITGHTEIYLSSLIASPSVCAFIVYCKCMTMNWRKLMQGKNYTCNMLIGYLKCMTSKFELLLAAALALKHRRQKCERPKRNNKISHSFTIVNKSRELVGFVERKKELSQGFIGIAQGIRRRRRRCLSAIVMLVCVYKRDR